MEPEVQYVYDKLEQKLYPHHEFTPLHREALSWQLSPDNSSTAEISEIAREKSVDLVFLTQAKAEQLILDGMAARNLIVDNIMFQKKFKFDDEPFTEAKLNFRHDLLTEEFNETSEALKNKDAEEFVDGLIDIVVIALGTLYLAGVSTDKAWTEVYRANMTKERGIKPGREQSGGFDIIKPEGWKGPDHSGNHGKLAEIFSKK